MRKQRHDSTQLSTPFRWTIRRERAAAMLAEDAASDEAIAAEVGINRATLALWKHHPDFQARIVHHLEVQRTAIEARGIADRRNRVARLNADWLAMQQLRDARKAAGVARLPTLPAHSEPGIDTGLVARQEKPTQFGTVIELAFDRALLAEMRDHEKQAAMELGYTVEETGTTRSAVTCPGCGHRHVPTGWQGNTVGCPDLYVSQQAWGNTWLALEVKKPGGKVQAEQRALAGLGMSRIVTSQEDAEAACREMDARVRKAV